jgi:hypothetical protein
MNGFLLHRKEIMAGVQGDYSPVVLGRFLNLIPSLPVPTRWPWPDPAELSGVF